MSQPHGRGPPVTPDPGSTRGLLLECLSSMHGCHSPCSPAGLTQTLSPGTYHGGVPRSRLWVRLNTRKDRYQAPATHLAISHIKGLQSPVFHTRARDRQSTASRPFPHRAYPRTSVQLKKHNCTKPPNPTSVPPGGTRSVKATGEKRLDF